MIYRNMKAEDISRIADIIEEGKPYLGLNGNYTYWMIGKLYHDYSFVAQEDDAVCGFVTVLPVPEEKSVFVWQLGVSSGARKCGVGYELLERVWERAVSRDLPGIITSISPENAASKGTFQKLASRYQLSMEKIDSYNGNDGFVEDVYRLW